MPHETKRPRANVLGASYGRCPQGGERALGGLEVEEPPTVTAEPVRAPANRYLEPEI